MRLILGMLLILSSAFITANDLLNQKVLAGDDLKDAQQAKNKLDSRIQPPDLQKYEDIRDGNDWLNPYLVIHPEGIELISRGPFVERKVISRHELKKKLISLPVTAWPYGRVIGVQEIGIRSGSPSSEIWRKDDELNEKNKIKVNRVLSSLGVRIKWWPSN